jgi:hypothetical protein
MKQQAGKMVITILIFTIENLILFHNAGSPAFTSFKDKLK